MQHAFYRQSEEAFISLKEVEWRYETNVRSRRIDGKAARADVAGRACLDEADIFRFESGLGPIANFQLSENVTHVIFYCTLGEEECVCDLSIAGSLTD